MATASNRLSLTRSGYARISNVVTQPLATAQFTLSTGNRVKLTTASPTTLKRRQLHIRHRALLFGTLTIYIGDQDVTDTDGFPLYQFDELILDVGGATDVYAFAEPDGGLGAVARFSIMETE